MQIYFENGQIELEWVLEVSPGYTVIAISANISETQPGGKCLQNFCVSSNSEFFLFNQSEVP